MRTHRRLVSLIAVLVILPLLVLGAYGVGYRLNLQTGQVPVPPVNASPEQIALTYMDAFNHRDRATMAELFPSRGGVNRFRAIGHYSNIQLVSGHPMSDSERTGGVGASHRDAYIVAVQLTYTGFDPGDVGYTPGPNGWNYYLVRDRPGDRWTIGDQGVL